MKLKHKKYFQATRNYNNKTVDIHPAALSRNGTFSTYYTRSGLPKKKLSLGSPLLLTVTQILRCGPKIAGNARKIKHCVTAFEPAMTSPDVTSCHVLCRLILSNHPQ